MSLVRFRARNHPQQVSLFGADDRVDDRCTPDWVWDPLDLEFAFTLDAAASTTNAKCPRYFTIEDDGLEQSWAGERVWVNPPFSACRAWVEKAWRESEAETIVMLLPANRTEQGWWQENVEPYRDRGERLSTRFVPRRISFATPGNPTARYRSSAPFGCVLLVWR
jgi:phage N-6-adenine-methyltransferase